MKTRLLYIAFLLLPLLVRTQTTTSADPEKLLDLMQSQKYKEAVSYIRSVYPDSINDDRIILRLAYCHYMAGNLPEAEKNYLILYRKDTLNTPAINSLANVNLKKGNYPAAISFLKKTLLKDSLNFFTFKQLGQIGQITGDTNTVKYLEKASALNPQDPDVAYDLSNIYILRKKFGRADTVLGKAIEADSSNLLLIRTRAKLLYAMDRWPEVVTLCTKLIKAGDESPSVSDWLAEAYYQTRQYKRCIDLILKQKQKNMEKESSLYFLAKSYKHLGDQSNAIKYFRKTIESSISPNIGNYYTEIGDSQEKLHQNRNALNTYVKSLQFEENAFTYYMIANLYDQALKDRKMAVVYFKKFLKSASASKLQDKQYIEYARSRINGTAD